VSALPVRARQPAGSQAEAKWAQIEAAAPPVAAVTRRYLRQLGTFLAPRSVAAAENALRQLARWVITEAGLATVAVPMREGGPGGLSQGPPGARWRASRMRSRPISNS
jgi:hypothetical protein